MDRAKVKLLLGIILLLVGGLAIPAGILIPALEAPNEEVIFETPGTASLDVHSPGRFYLWHDYRTLHDGRQVVRDEHLPDGMSFSVTRADGSTLPLQSRAGITTEMSGSASRSIGYVDVEQPGTLRVDVRGGDEQMRVMSFERAQFKLFASAVGWSLLSLAVLGTAGIVLIVLGIVRRA